MRVFIDLKKQITSYHLFQPELVNSNALIVALNEGDMPNINQIYLPDIMTTLRTKTDLTLFMLTKKNEYEKN